MKSHNRYLHRLLLVCAVAWTATTWAQPDEVKLRLVGQWPGYSRGLAEGVVVSGRFAHCAIDAGGLMVFDVSNPGRPERVGGCDSGEVKIVAVSGNYAYRVQDSWGFGVIEISNPANPQRVGGYDTSRGAYGVAVSGN
jgi:hypothetical protein